MNRAGAINLSCFPLFLAQAVCLPESRVALITGWDAGMLEGWKAGGRRLFNAKAYEGTGSMRNLSNAECGMRSAEFLQCRMRIAECGIYQMRNDECGLRNFSNVECGVRNGECGILQMRNTQGVPEFGMRSGGWADPVSSEAPARAAAAGRGAPRRADGAIRAWRLEVAAAMRSPLARAG